MKTALANRHQFLTVFAIALIAVATVLTPWNAAAQGSEQPQPTLSRAGTSSWSLDWAGISARTYFVQYSHDLQSWAYFPTIQSGTGQQFSWAFDSTASKFFVRLRYTDQETYDPLYDDFDGDWISNWDEINYYQTDPFNLDTEGDGVHDGQEIYSYGSNPNSSDSDGDGLTDGQEVNIYGSSPTSTDSDGDGLSDGEEVGQTNTSPINADTDGDGTNDGDEIGQGTSPNDSSSFLFQWHRVTRSLQYDFDEYPPPSNRGWLTLSCEWDSSLSSTEDLTARIPFPSLRPRLEAIPFPDDAPQSGAGNGLFTGWGYSSLLPNPPCYHASMTHHRYWFRRDTVAPTPFSIRAIRVLERTIDGTADPIAISAVTITIPANETTAPPSDLVEGFTRDWSDNTYHRESYTHTLCPLELAQTNMPNIGVAENSTDLGGQRGRRLIGIGGTAFITGQPAMAQLRARFRKMPASVSVEWRLEIRSERTERGALDDRNFPTTGWVTLQGDQEWDIAAAMQGEFVGGNCTLHYRINGGNAGSISFRLRGKNSLDADARARITASVGADFTVYAWAMAQHESRQGNRVYNQFNTQGGIEGTLNFGGPNGWGVCQIDRKRLPDDIGVSTAEVWNWHQNVAAMQAKLVEKQATYRQFIGYFRSSYGNQANWSEPPAAHIEGATTLPAEAWGVMVLYNGADGGVPVSRPPSRPQGFSLPWIFNPQSGVWTFHDNSQDYASGPTRVRPELEGTTNIQE